VESSLLALESLDRFQGFVKSLFGVNMFVAEFSECLLGGIPFGGGRVPGSDLDRGRMHKEIDFFKYCGVMVL
jgi:hypothetical protein